MSLRRLIVTVAAFALALPGTAAAEPAAKVYFAAPDGGGTACSATRPYEGGDPDAVTPGRASPRGDQDTVAINRTAPQVVEPALR